MKSRTKWSIVWMSWVAFFGVAEYVAIRSNDHDAPLSAHLRYALGTKRQPLYRRVGQLSFVSFIAWLYLHLWKVVDAETDSGQN
jgi:hypothetical protein